MARKHKHEEHANHERWLVSYADFITLLFATFTALYALSRSDVDKAKAVAESMRYHFGATTNSIIPRAALDQLGIPSDKPVPQQARRTPVLPTKDAGRMDLEAIKSQIESFLMVNKLLGKVRVEVGGEGLSVSLAEAGFFESGRAELLPESRRVLAEVAARLRDFANPIRVEGHTDNTPIHSRTYPSNWELSSARASHVARLLAADYGIWPARLSAAGYGEFKPASSNETPTGRNRNRRVDIVLLAGGPASPGGKTRENPPSWSEPAGTGTEPIEIP